ncbi:MAG TPA: hypothetical protein VHA56_05785 [Mucilaginibacter sp.]|nr:hypothetical protein [Mucilaginibacter sp.]
MKKIFLLALATLLSSLFISSCKNDHSYPAGLEQFENYYYLGFLPWNNKLVSVNRDAGIVKFPVEFHSAYVRSYNADAHYTLVTDGIASPAVPGQDFNIVDKDGNVLQPVDGNYTITFPQAKYKIDTIYVQLLNNPTPGTRQTEIDIVVNKTDQYTVGNFSDAFRRPLEIK